jgi:FkbM family methyltransferase
VSRHLTTDTDIDMSFFGMISRVSLAELVVFARRAPSYFYEDLSRRLCKELGLGHGYIAINRNIFFQCPSDTVAQSVFRDMAYGARDRRELDEFLELSTGCRSLIDVGASGGFFSVLFAVSRSDPCRVLSIEPDPKAHRVLADVRSKNPRYNVDWRLDGRGVMGAAQVVRFVSSGYGAEPVGRRAIRNAGFCATANNLQVSIEDIPCATLEQIASDNGVTPDIIKIDIESYEFELIGSSFTFLSRTKPRIMLELHVSAMAERGLDPRIPLGELASIGYRRLRTMKRKLESLANEADESGVVRVGLVP